MTLLWLDLRCEPPLLYKAWPSFEQHSSSWSSSRWP